MRMREVEQGRLWVSERHVEALERAGLLSFESLYEAKGTLATRERPGKRREVVRIELDVEEEKRGFYLKRHDKETLGERIAGWMEGDGCKTPARREWENIELLTGMGIPTMTGVAWGEDAGTGRSLSLTEELKDYEPLDEHIAKVDYRERRRLATELGELVRRLHSAGLTHKDLYLCHVFATRGGGDETDLRLIDVQRVGRRGLRLRRWRVKDVAQLEYSRPTSVTRTDCVRFLRAYFGVGKLGSAQKDFVRSVMAKAESIRVHDMKKRGGI